MCTSSCSSTVPLVHLLRMILLASHCALCAVQGKRADAQRDPARGGSVQRPRSDQAGPHSAAAVAAAAAADTPAPDAVPTGAATGAAAVAAAAAAAAAQQPLAGHAAPAGIRRAAGQL